MQLRAATITLPLPFHASIAEISTYVPIRGRARRTSAQGVLLEEEEALDAIGHVTAGKCRAADVGDVDTELERIGDGFPDKLIAPLQLANLIAVARACSSLIYCLAMPGVAATAIIAAGASQRISSVIGIFF